MKTCSRCHEEHPDDWYAKHSISKKTGEQLYKSYCRNCKTAKNKQERAERRLGKKSCVKCKELLDITAFHTSKNGLKKACKSCEAADRRICRICDVEKDMTAFRRNGWGGNRQECYECEGEKKRSYEGRAAALRSYHDRIARDPYYKIIYSLRNATRWIFKSVPKDAHTQELVGCSHEEYREYISSKFKEGMTMDNYGHGGWVIDHVTPLASFDIYDPAERAKALHYSNTQPLWEWENGKKGDKMVDGTLGRFLRPPRPQSD